MKGSCSVQVRPTQELGHLRSDSDMLRGSEFPGRCSREAGWAGQGGGHPEARAMGRGGPGGGWQRAAGEDDALRGQTARATRSSSARRRPGPPGAAPRHASLAGERWGVPVGPPGSRPHLHPETCSIPAPPGTELGTLSALPAARWTVTGGLTRGQCWQPGLWAPKPACDLLSLSLSPHPAAPWPLASHSLLPSAAAGGPDHTPPLCSVSTCTDTPTGRGDSGGGSPTLPQPHRLSTHPIDGAAWTRTSPAFPRVPLSARGCAGSHGARHLPCPRASCLCWCRRPASPRPVAQAPQRGCCFLGRRQDHLL